MNPTGTEILTLTAYFAERERHGGRFLAEELLERYDLEIGAGAGAYAASVWRIGLMGPNAAPDKVALVLAALKDVLHR